MGPVPFILVVNKEDLKDQWEIDPAVLDDVRAQGGTVVITSAKTNARVEEAFKTLAEMMVAT